jgi:hypothetical protein
VREKKYKSRRKGERREEAKGILRRRGKKRQLSYLVPACFFN